MSEDMAARFVQYSKGLITAGELILYVGLEINDLTLARMGQEMCRETFPDAYFWHMGAAPNV